MEFWRVLCVHTPKNANCGFCAVGKSLLFIMRLVMCSAILLHIPLKCRSTLKKKKYQDQKYLDQGSKYLGLKSRMIGPNDAAALFPLRHKAKLKDMQKCYIKILKSSSSGWRKTKEHNFVMQLCCMSPLLNAIKLSSTY